MRADCIVVLCHFLKTDGTLRDEFRERLDAAVRLQQKGKLSLIINGGQTKGTPVSHGRAARNYLLSRGVPEERILWGEEGHDTLDELRTAESMMSRRGWDTPIIITNRLHLLQVRLSCWRRGKKCIPYFTRRHDRSVKYVLERLIALPLTLLDPNGKGWPFRFLRFLRARVFGQTL